MMQKSITAMSPVSIVTFTTNANYLFDSFFAAFFFSFALFFA